MNIRMIRKDMKVHHIFFDHWGEGTVVDIRHKDNIGLPTSMKVLVKWSNNPKELPWMRASELRKTPKGTRKGTRL